MKLTYRGIAYEVSNLTLNPQKTGLNVTYRGQSYQLSSPLNIISKPFPNLIYRGVQYPQSLLNNSTAITQNLQPVLN